jgi:hypothetical protein
MMKLVAHVITALALVAFATPALPCGLEKSNKTASQPEAQTQTSGAVAKADRGEKAQKSEKAQKAKRAEAQKAAATN